MKKDDLTFWNIIDEEFGTYDVLDEASFNNMFTVIQPVPGVIIMINEDIHGQETW
jgi:hypothetical protein|tara:strand:+ start:244 stop:408 length:165 start_codon:yes stop_codon:yes gene_type:complete